MIFSSVTHIWPKTNQKRQLISKIAGDPTATESSWLQLPHEKFHTQMPTEFIFGHLCLSTLLLLLGGPQSEGSSKG